MQSNLQRLPANSSIKVIRSGSNNKRILFVVTAAIVLLSLYLLVSFDAQIHELLAERMGGLASRADTVVNVMRLVLLGILAYLLVRVLNSLIFGLIYRLRSGFEAPTLVRNIFSIVAFTALFLLIFSAIFEGVNLGALFTTSAIFGVILGLALQDTLGNFLRRNLPASRSAFSNRRCHHGRSPKSHRRGRRDHLARRKDSHLSESCGAD